MGDCSNSASPTLIFLLNSRQRKEDERLPDIQVLIKPVAFGLKSQCELQPLSSFSEQKGRYGKGEVSVCLRYPVWRLLRCFNTFRRFCIPPPSAKSVSETLRYEV
ncbi:hypothetical protein AVEN_16955-1 [Araneus ventricosus]|uniref:Uncharacterized protein n=1 Tax=Araneus ventricosus TaxID=182803 RepID=A0A4Y2D7T9_ARAVE|nr:hypothetical protein AVEN_16955-1 [Araneus ventricosus]